MTHSSRGRARAALATFACAASLALHAQDVAQGRELFMRKDKGNCIACHEVPSDPAIATRATVGPALSGIRERLPERAALREMLVDPARRNPATLMPPYGRHQILGGAEIERLIDYLHAIR
jgi:sulfur-oxidizing protein SoxX